MRVWAIVPCRSGSKGLPNKNIRPLAGVPLIGHAIKFASDSGLFERVLVSTDSDEYAKIAQDLGGWVPFLRSPEAAADGSMEEDVLADLVEKLDAHGIVPPDFIVWLRPVFPFRAVSDLKRALALMEPGIDSVRLVTEGEPRLYKLDGGYLTPMFEDGGRSMVRRQEFPDCVKVFHTDIFRFENIKLHQGFLGTRVIGVKVHKICGVDVDALDDFEVADALIRSGSNLVRQYSAVASAEDSEAK